MNVGCQYTLQMKVCMILAICDDSTPPSAIPFYLRHNIEVYAFPRSPWFTGFAVASPYWEDTSVDSIRNTWGRAKKKKNGTKEGRSCPKGTKKKKILNIHTCYQGKDVILLGTEDNSPTLCFKVVRFFSFFLEHTTISEWIFWIKCACCLNNVERKPYCVKRRYVP